jgi:hypothetical protein
MRDKRGGKTKKTYVCVHLLRTIILIVVLTQLTLVTARHLRTYTHPIADLHCLDVLAHPHRRADDLMPGNDGEHLGHVAPPVGDGVYIGPAHAAVRDGDFDVGLGPLLRGKFDHGEVGPFLGVCV